MREATERRWTTHAKIYTEAESKRPQKGPLACGNAPTLTIALLTYFQSSLLPFLITFSLTLIQLHASTAWFKRIVLLTRFLELTTYWEKVLCNIGLVPIYPFQWSFDWRKYIINSIGGAAAFAHNIWSCLFFKLTPFRCTSFSQP